MHFMIPVCFPFQIDSNTKYSNDFKNINLKTCFFVHSIPFGKNVPFVLWNNYAFTSYFQVLIQKVAISKNKSNFCFVFINSKAILKNRDLWALHKKEKYVGQILALLSFLQAIVHVYHFVTSIACPRERAQLLMECSCLTACFSIARTFKSDWWHQLLLLLVVFCFSQTPAPTPTTLPQPHL